MSNLGFDRLLEFLTRIETEMAMLWLGLVIFTAGLAILMYTRWGQYKPLRKCLAMSLLAHLLLAGYAATVEIIPPIPRLAEQPIRVSLGDGPDEKAPAGGSAALLSKLKEQPWEAFPNDALAQPVETKLDRGTADPPPAPQRVVRAEDRKLPGDPDLSHVALADVKVLKPKATTIVEAAGRSPSESAAAIEAPPAQHRAAVQPTLPGGAVPPQRLAKEVPAQPSRATTNDVPAALLEQIVPLPKMSETDAEPLGTAPAAANPMRLQPVERVATKVGGDAAYAGSAEPAAPDPNSNPTGPPDTDVGRRTAPSIAGLTGKSAAGEGGTALLASNTPRLELPDALSSRTREGQPAVPDAYRLRVAPNRAGVAQSHGGTAETEAAVKAALKWLADNQSADGRWDPRTHDAGKENNVAGRNRQSAGSRADAAMTGLALLAFLGSGHTHLDGPYRNDVRRGIEFLMQTQAADGSLGGQAAVFEFMYCHAIAACSLSEAYGMTHDPRLREPVRRAIGYTIAAQDPKGGGWRYRPGDAGDTSQMGWQLMSLKSAELAGLAVPEQTRQGVIRYLQSVSSGRYGGRASYRPNEQPTRPMTAEALVCWQFLGLAREHPACNEASDFLVGELPGEGAYNLYYWYYATLGMYQLQGDGWQRWNEALRATLVSRQVKEGPQAGSWDTNDVWGGYGGRIYTTAVATLTLEVYYRFLPLYAGAAAMESRGK